MIIYSPLIGNVIPAFTKASNTIKIPFEHNPAVSSYIGMALRVLDFASNTIITSSKYYSSNIISPVTFTVSSNSILPG